MKDIAVNAFELYAKVFLNNDDYKKKLDESESKFSKFAGSLKNGLTTAAKVGAAALGAAATAVTALTKASIENYAEYEQLVGGMEKIFSSMNTDKIATDAANAYKDLGMSASEYLAVINDVGASFASTMGDAKGYEAAKKGLTAISDYASGTGKNFDELQQKLAMITRSTSSYQSIADQFSGVLPATSDGFLKQAQAAGILSTKYKELTDVPIDEYQKAVTDMLAKGVDALGLTGNTAAEATETISGSLAMTKASWENLLTGIADDSADFDSLINNFVTSVTAFAGQIIPRIQTALGGIGTLITELAPVIGEQLPVLMEMLLPAVIEGAMSILSAVGDALPGLILSLSKAVEQISVKLTEMLQNGLTNSESLDAILEATETLIMSLGDFLIKNAPLLIKVALDIVIKLAEWLADNAESMTDSAIDLILALAYGLLDALPKLIPAVVDIITGIADALLDEENLSILAQAAVDIGEGIIMGIWDAIKRLGTWFSDKLKGWFGNAMDDVKKDQEIHSPSKLWARLVGKPIGQGVGEGAVEGLEESEKNIFYTFDKMSKKAIEKVEKLADEIKKRLDEIHGYFETTSDIAELEYEMWELTEGLDASEAEKAAKKIELLNKQLTDQKQIVDASSAAYEEMIKLYGEGSVEAMEYKKALLEEQVEYQKMQNELNETNKSYKQLAKSQRTWATVAVDAAKLVTSAFKETVQVSDAATTKNEKATSKISDDIKELISLFTSGKAKTAVSNARDLRSVSYG